MTTQIKAGVIAANAITASELASSALSGGSFTGDVTFDTNTLVVDSSNNRVGIGTASPSASLDIVKPSTAIAPTLNLERNTYNYIQFDASGGASAEAWVGIVQGVNNNFTISNQTSADILFNTNAAERMRIDSSGNVGIGTNSPQAYLHVYGTSAETLRLEGNDEFTYLRFRGTVASTGTNLGYIGYANDTGTAADLNLTNQQSGGDISIRTNAGAGTAERMRIDSSGKVGINTTVPAAYLGFNAESYTNGTEDSASIRWNDSGTADALIQTWINSTSGIGMLLGGNTYVNSSGGIAKFDSSKNSSCFVADPPNNKASIWMSETTMSSPVEVFTVNGIDSTNDGGAVGININNPSARAYFVVRPLATTGSVCEYTNFNGSRMWFYIMDGGYGYQAVEKIYSNGGINRYFTNTSDTAVGSIGVGASSTSYNTTSDYRLKDNPQPLTGSGEFIDALQPKTWTWNHSDAGTGVGFIAHEAAEVGLGLCVTGEKDAESIDKVWNEETQEFEEQVTPTYQQVDYSNGELIANMVAELQSLRARVAELENN